MNPREGTLANGERIYRCFYCGKAFRTFERRDDHEPFCAQLAFEDGTDPDLEEYNDE